MPIIIGNICSLFHRASLRTTNSPSANSSPNASPRPPLRVLAFGNLFLTHRLLVPSYPEAGGVARAQDVQTNRGGHSANVLAVLAQFRSSRLYVPPNTLNPAFGVAPVVAGARSVGDVQFCGPLGGNEKGIRVVKELEAQGVGTNFSVVRDGKGVPAAWIIKSGEATETIINHNPLPDITHDEFVARLGPILSPEMYISNNPLQPLPLSAASASAPHAHARKHSGSGHQTYGSPPSGCTQPPYQRLSMPGMPSFDWIHFEGRAAPTTLANITKLNGLAKERGWRARCVFSLAITCEGVEALIPHADVVFFSKPYAQSVFPSASPRSFLISMSAYAAPHALLVVDWGTQGAALLSIPTREYLQSSGWVEACSAAKPSWDSNVAVMEGGVFSSVRTGSGFWADGRPRSCVTFTGSEGTGSALSSTPAEEQVLTPSEGDSDSRRTSIETERGTDGQVVDAVGAHEAFVAGMMFGLSQKILPGRPYVQGGDAKTPLQAHVAGELVGADVLPGGSGGGSGKWRLEECLRFATELSGRKGRRIGFEDLRQEMDKAGWVVE